MAKLRITTHNGAESEHELVADVVLGRDDAADVRIRDLKVSRRHCRVYQKLGAWSVEDMGSANGMTVNGTRCRKHLLASGDEIRIGRSVIRFECPPPPVFKAPVSRTERERRERRRRS